MDASTSLVNVKKSIKKYFLDFFGSSGKNKQVVFDKWVTPDFFATQLAGEWIFINFGDARLKNLSHWDITAFCYTKGDQEGVNLSKLQDFIVESVTDDNSDRKVIEFYDTTVTPWSLIGGITIHLVSTSGDDLGNGVNGSLTFLRAYWGANR
jgi:hypothetical protein